MKKKIIGISIIAATILLSGCSANNSAKNTYKNALKQVNASLNDYSEKLELKSYNFNDDDLKEEDDLYNLYGTRTLVGFLYELYTNTNYPADEKAHHMVCNFVDDNNNILQSNEMTISSIIDKDNNKILFEGFGISNGDFGYYVIDIDYDFHNKNVDSFVLFIADVDNSLDENIHSDDSLTEVGACNVYKNDTLYTPNKSFYVDILNYYISNYWNNFKTVVDNANNVGDYSKEYTKVTNELHPEFEY